VSVGEGAAERVTVTADDATLMAVEGIAAILHAHGFVVERRVFVRAAAETEEPRRVVLLALERPLPALVALVVPPAGLPGLGAALAAALYPDGEAHATGAVATLQCKGGGRGRQRDGGIGGGAGRRAAPAGRASARGVVVDAAGGRRRAPDRLCRASVVRRVTVAARAVRPSTDSGAG